MKLFKDCPDQTIINLFDLTSPETPLGDIYDYIALRLRGFDYVQSVAKDGTIKKLGANAVASQLKKALKKRKRIPQRPTLADYRKPRARGQKDPSKLN